MFLILIYFLDNFNITILKYCSAGISASASTLTSASASAFRYKHFRLQNINYHLKFVVPIFFITNSKACNVFSNILWQYLITEIFEHILISEISRSGEQYCTCNLVLCSCCITINSSINILYLILIHILLFPWENIIGHLGTSASASRHKHRHWYRHRHQNSNTNIVFV